MLEDELNLFKNIKRRDIFRGLHELEGCKLIDRDEPWIQVSHFTAYKDDFRKDMSSREIIRSYINSAKYLNRLSQKGFRSGINECKIIKNNLITMPILYLCRHAIELSIKINYSNRTGDLPAKEHKLIKLIDRKNANFNKYYPELIEFIKIMYAVDNDGTKFRYAEDTNGIGYDREKCAYANLDKIIELTDMFIEIMLKKGE